MKVGGGSSMGCYPKDCGLCLKFRNGEGDAINGQGAFGYTEILNFRRERDFQPMVLALGTPVADAPDRIDMALHEVTTKAVSDAQGALEVDE